MQRHRYRGPLIEHGRPVAGLARLLDRRDTLVEAGAAGSPRVVLGVPHHARIGVPRIAERSHSGGRVSDENAVLYALACLESLAARELPARLVVAAHATDHDPNKRADSAYCSRALAFPSALLIECHGAGPRAPHDLEVSAGRNPHADPLVFGRLLAQALGPGFHLAAQTRPGSRNALLLDARRPDGAATLLRFPALRTQSLWSAGVRGMAALHVEAKPRFRSRGDGSAALTASGARLGEALARAAVGYLRGRR